MPFLVCSKHQTCHSACSQHQTCHSVCSQHQTRHLTCSQHQTRPWRAALPVRGARCGSASATLMCYSPALTRAVPPFWQDSDSVAEHLRPGGLGRARVLSHYAPPWLTPACRATLFQQLPPKPCGLRGRPQEPPGNGRRRGARPWCHRRLGRGHDHLRVARSRERHREHVWQRRRRRRCRGATHG